MGKGSGRRRPFSLGGSELIVAIDDDAFLDLEPEVRRVLTRAPLPIQIVRASTLADPDAEADLHFGRYSPTTPECQLILEYISAGRIDRFEQDACTGAVYRAGALVWPSAPIETASLNGGSDLTPGADGVLLFAQGRQSRVTTIPDVMLVRRQFRTRAPASDEAGWPPDWIEQGRAALGEASAPRRN